MTRTRTVDLPPFVQEWKRRASKQAYRSHLARRRKEASWLMQVLRRIGLR